jgi:hypothetical protein
MRKQIHPITPPADPAPWEESMPDPRPLDCATPKGPPPADPRLMFFLLLPATIVLANLIGFRAIAAVDAIYHTDPADVGSACLLVAALPFAPIGLIIALIEAIRKEDGGRALLHGLVWNLILLVGFVLAFVVLSAWTR